MTAGDSTVVLIQAVSQRDAESFAAKMADSSLEAAVDIWLRRIARRKLSAAARTRLVRAVERGDAAETRAVQLTRAALLRRAGLDERPAAAAAIAAGATYTEVGAVLGMTQQGASARIRPYLTARAGTDGAQT
ncbi:Fis family transcriptional regulator [Mycolicibacterium neoaurum]|uniref:Fis family transcriptional regulator n=1 Tax=Mycolicibacterium neoaurum TaxID=1795 RepID=UPI001F4CA1F4|nr:Fis family transcriptional regulator [Mycolicibacterium neoaurum]